MLVFFVLSFLLFASPVIESEPLLNSTLSLINSNESSLGMLSSDTTAAADVEAFGNGVLIKSTGKAELILKDRTLKIKADIAEHCVGHVQICFPFSDNEESKAKNVCPGLCAFNIKSDAEGVEFIFKRIDHKTCGAPIHMQNGRKTDYCGTIDWGCDPLINADTNKIAIEVTYMTYSCPVFIDNAEIAPKPTPSVPLIAGPSTEKIETANASTLPWYAWVILTVVILLVVAVIVGLIVCWRKKIVFFKNCGDSKDVVDSQASRIAPKPSMVKAQTEKSKVAAAEVKADKKQKKAAKEKSLRTAQEATLDVKTPPSPPAIKPVKTAVPAPVQKPRVKADAPCPVEAKTEAPPLPIHDYHEFEAPQELQRKIDWQEQERQRRIRAAAMQPQLLPGDICKPHPSRRSSIRPPPFPKPPQSRHQKQRKRRSQDQDSRENSTEAS